MATFKSYDPRKTTAGPGRVAVAGPVISPDIDAIADVMSNSTFIFKVSAPELWEDLGATENGIQLSKGFQQTELRHDLAESPVKTEITGHSVSVSSNLTDTGDLDTIRLAWGAGAVTAIVGPPEARKMGIGTFTVLTHKSFALVEIDEEGLLRVYWLRDTTLNAGDAAINVAPGSFHSVPINYIAYSSSAAASTYEFGMIIEEDGFGGIDNV